MKLMLCLVCASLVFVSCAREVHQVDEYYNVTPNVTPAPPMEPTYQPPVTPTYQPPVAPTYQPPTTPTYQPPVTPQPQVNSNVPSWANETIRETGQGAIPEKYRNEPGRARLMAERAASMDGRRRLLERVLGLRLDSKTLVRDMVTESDEINAATSGYVKEAYDVGKNFDGEVANVTVELKLYNVYMYMRTKRVYYE